MAVGVSSPEGAAGEARSLVSGKCSVSISRSRRSTCAFSSHRPAPLLVFQLQGLNHNVIFTLDSLLKGDLKGVKGVSGHKFDFPCNFERIDFVLSFEIIVVLVLKRHSEPF